VTDPLTAALEVVAALDAVQIPYSIGGSLASSFSGEPRASIDADIVVGLRPEQVGPLVQALGPDFYADAVAIGRAVQRGSSVNVIHRPSGIKIDLFVARSTLDQLQLERRQEVHLSRDPARSIFVHSPEDILLQKLHWFRRGGETSERQWRDVLAIVLVQGDRLDRAYLARTAADEGLDDLLGRVLKEAGAP